MRFTYGCTLYNRPIQYNCNQSQPTLQALIVSTQRRQ